MGTRQVIIPDLNILLHAANSQSTHHEICHTWLEKAVNEARETIGLPLVVRLGFIRLTTSARVFEKPMELAEAFEWLDGLIARQNVRFLEPGSAHQAILRHLLLAIGTGGNLVTDAHIAALALEHDASIVTGDRDFQRFPGLRVTVLY